MLGALFFFSGLEKREEKMLGGFVSTLVQAEIEAGGGDPNKSDDNFEAVDENGSDARYSNQTKRCIRNWEDGNQLDIDLLCEVIKFICSGEMGPGAVLVFLTGWEEITKVGRLTYVHVIRCMYLCMFTSLYTWRE